MSSDFSSTIAYCDSVESRTSTAQSRFGSVSETPTLATKHSKTSKSSSRSSSRNLSTTSSNRSTGSFSKPPSNTSSKLSSKTSHKHKSKHTLAEIRANGQSYEESSHPMPAPIGHSASPTRSIPRYASSATIMTEAEYRARMQALLFDIGPQLDLNGTQLDFYDTQLDRYDSQLELDDDEPEQTYDPENHG